MADTLSPQRAARTAPPQAPQPPEALQMQQHAITLTVNGQPHQLQVEAWVTLLDLLRDKLLLTGTKKGCDHGQCGACTVLVDGKRINSCLTLAVMRNGCEVTTVEGLAALNPGTGHGACGDLHPLQQAFIEHDAFQCGYCTPGQLCSAVGLMNEGQAKTPDEVRELMSGNICRCGAYPQIAAAVSEVALGARPARAGSLNAANNVSSTGTQPVTVGTVPA